MILVSIDPNARQVAMVSIPRDFWVPIPGHGTAKIDVAYEVGGLALARSTVERLFGIGIDYYAWVGLDGFVNIVDALGGVNVTVLHPVLDEMYPDDLNTKPIRLFSAVHPRRAAAPGRSHSIRVRTFATRRSAIGLWQVCPPAATPHRTEKLS
jgi:anionic cell wall polymer biosynthesis LytR-Cps2A-Psr (LCP) family protein